MPSVMLLALRCDDQTAREITSTHGRAGTLLTRRLDAIAPHLRALSQHEHAAPSDGVRWRLDGPQDRQSRQREEKSERVRGQQRGVERQIWTLRNLSELPRCHRRTTPLPFEPVHDAWNTSTAGAPTTR